MKKKPKEIVSEMCHCNVKNKYLDSILEKQFKDFEEKVLKLLEKQKNLIKKAITEQETNTHKKTVLEN